MSFNFLKLIVHKEKFIEQNHFFLSKILSRKFEKKKEKTKKMPKLLIIIINWLNNFYWQYNKARIFLFNENFNN